MYGVRWTRGSRTAARTAPLHYPVAAIETAADGSWIQRFQTGCIVDSTQTTTQVVHGIRWTRWVAAGRETGVLGYPVAGVELLPNGAWIQRFQNGCITDSTATTTRVVPGATWTAWQQVGRETGAARLPEQ